uniref:Tr-type G domain-containing protein n=1 Tax=Noctiluca scintillans TaxID=2966 RepID=A0A7S1FCT1_NOCSC
METDEAAAKAEAPASKPAGASINVNIGVLGHIDSGKTSLCRALSTVTSTASMDKHPQSQERGITLDLGFSSFSADASDSFKQAGYDTIQVCLVDCPGHASLIRTVIGGAQIIDLCMLVIDANKGIQTQTAECLVVAEILVNQLVIILNKVDMIPEAERETKLDKITKKLRGTFSKTKFGANLPFVCVAANPQDGSPSIGVDELVKALAQHCHMPQRDKTGPFMFSYDHAFPIKGQGTVLTGTILSGAVSPGQVVDVVALGQNGKGKKVRSLQMFKKPAQQAIQGDRVAMCIPQLDSTDLERGLVIGTKVHVPTIDACICVVDRLSYFKHPVNTKAKFHITLGHQTVMATAHFFCPLDGRALPSTSTLAAVRPEETAPASKTDSKPMCLQMNTGALVADRQRKWPKTFSFGANYLHLDELFQHGAPVTYENNDGDPVKLAAGKEPGKLEFYLHGELKKEITSLRYDSSSGRLSAQDGSPLGATVDSRGVIPLKNRDRVIYLLSWLAQSAQVPGLPPAEEPLAYALLLLEKPVVCPIGSLLIGSKLDFDSHSPNCRMAFFGRILTAMDPKDISSLKLIKMKSKTGCLDRFDKQDKTLVTCKDMFKADTDMSLFYNLKVVHEQSGIEGVLEGAFGTAGKFKVRFTEELTVRSDQKGIIRGQERISLYFKKFDFEQSRKIIQ